MKFEIKKDALEKEKVDNGYYVTIECMSDDGCENEMVGPFNKDNEVEVRALTLLINMLDNIFDYDYLDIISDEIPEISIWTDGYDIEDARYDDDIRKFISTLSLTWPGDYPGDCDTELVQYTVTYHDGDVDYPVEIIYEDDDED